MEGPNTVASRAQSPILVPVEGEGQWGVVVQPSSMTKGKGAKIYVRSGSEGEGRRAQLCRVGYGVF